MNKKQEEQFDNFIKDKYKEWYSDLLNKEIKQFISSLLKAQRKDILNKIKNSEICLGCGKDKKPSLSDWCIKCLETL